MSHRILARITSRPYEARKPAAEKTELRNNLGLYALRNECPPCLNFGLRMEHPLRHNHGVPTGIQNKKRFRLTYMLQYMPVDNRRSTTTRCSKVLCSERVGYGFLQ